MTINQRVKLLVDFEGTAKKFSKKTGIGPSTISNMIKEDSPPDPRFQTLMSIVFAYPELSIDWLFKGEGEMWLGGISGGDVKKGRGRAKDPFKSFVDELKDMRGRIKKLEEEVGELKKNSKLI